MGSRSSERPRSKGRHILPEAYSRPKASVRAAIIERLARGSESSPDGLGELAGQLADAAIAYALQGNDRAVGAIESFVRMTEGPLRAGLPAPARAQSPRRIILEMVGCGVPAAQLLPLVAGERKSQVVEAQALTDTASDNIHYAALPSADAPKP